MKTQKTLGIIVISALLKTYSSIKTFHYHQDLEIQVCNKYPEQKCWQYAIRKHLFLFIVHDPLTYCTNLKYTIPSNRCSIQLITLYTTILHEDLKPRLYEIVHITLKIASNVTSLQFRFTNSFVFVLSSMSQKKKVLHRKWWSMSSSEGTHCQQIIPISMEANCAPVIADRIYSYETGVYKHVSKTKKL